ncbi:IucC family-domain-containing protein [Mucidula mucida]|nr:IucC family-domain-containing protein [Mucidula mucida]
MDIDTLAPSPLPLFTAFAKSANLSADMEAAIAEELESAAHWTTVAETHPPPIPTATSAPIVFEQSIVSGHPTHPMHKTRAALPPLILEPSYDLLHPRLRLVAVPRESLRLSGEYDSLITPFLAQYPSFTLPSSDHVAVPVHELQVAHILKMKDLHLYPPIISVPALAQQSLRSVLLPGVQGTHLKLPLGVKLTSAVRTISPPSALFGVPFCQRTLPKLTYDRTILTVLEERASLISTHPDPLISRHLACIIRDNPSPPPGEAYIVSTSLVDRPAAYPQALFHLTTPAQRVAWFTKYVTLLLDAFLPPILNDGLAFECHPQNTILRCSLPTGDPLGFFLRDFGGLKIHAPSLPESIFDYANPEHSIFAHSIDDVWTRMYHTLVHNHVQQLARVMDLHHSAQAYCILHVLLLDRLPASHPWLTLPTQPGKCFLRMRLASMDRFHLHAPFPNLVLWRGDQQSEVHNVNLDMPYLTNDVPRWGKIEG